jgi:competence protein ComEC
MPLSKVPIWKEAPFLRLLPPFITGIFLRWHVNFPVNSAWIAFLTITALLLSIHQARLHFRFRFNTISGILLNLLLLVAGILLTGYHDPLSHPRWISSKYEGHPVKATLQAPLSPKARSYKTIAAANQLIAPGKSIPVNGNLLIYFSKEVDPTVLSYGSVILVNKPLQPVKNSGNPGAFDYERYCRFNRIAYQVYLRPGDFALAPRKETRVLAGFITYCRQKIIYLLDSYIHGAKENALAEALLIGYKDDLDKNLVQSYSNTGVVHVIAISGMHLGIIYWLLGWVLRPLTRQKHTRPAGFLLILTGLWLFTLLAGAGPSVVRSAVMFSFIATGDAFSRRSPVYNNLAASAFLLLCWDPLWLWDVGFQLSYAAVLSIVVFFRPVYSLVFVQNKLLEAIWKLAAVTLAAQILTTPISLYHFHQFPNLFLLANIVAVPLSSLVLLGEVFLCLVSFMPFLAAWTGSALSFLIGLLNRYIENLDSLPFATWQGLMISPSQLFLLLSFTAAAGFAWLHRNKQALLLALLCLLAFAGLRLHSFRKADGQRKVIVYNVPGKQAVDIIIGRNFYFVGHPSLSKDSFPRNFYLQPARRLYRVLPGELFHDEKSNWLLDNNRLLILGAHPLLSVHPSPGPAAGRADLLLLSENMPWPLLPLLETFQAKQVVADASNKARFIRQWKQDCEKAGIPFHAVSEKGAFVWEGARSKW